MKVFELLNIFYLLEEYYRIDRCRRCECLHGALWRLRALVDSVEDGERREFLLVSIDRLLSASNLHPCMGCEQCEPANLIVVMGEPGRYLCMKE